MSKGFKRIHFSLQEKDYYSLMDVLSYLEDGNEVQRKKINRLANLLIKQRSRKSFDYTE